MGLRSDTEHREDSDAVSRVEDDQSAGGPVEAGAEGTPGNAGWSGSALVVVVALLVVVGTWLLARGAPSAESDPTPPPTPTPAHIPGRFGLPPFPTAGPVVIRRPPAPQGITEARPTATPVAKSRPGVPRDDRYRSLASPPA